MQDEAVLISIRPQWCERIARKIKTIEVRKTKPKLQPPFKVYIYCTKAKSHYAVGHIGLSDDELHKLSDGQIKCGSSIELRSHDNYTVGNFLNGKIIGEFVCDKVIEWHEDSVPPVPLKLTGMSYPEIRRYWNDDIEKVYLWHISNLKLYDVPKSVSDFGLKRPPQSWGYVKERELNDP